MPLFKSFKAAVRGGGDGDGTDRWSDGWMASLGERSIARSIESGRRFLRLMLDRLEVFEVPLQTVSRLVSAPS